MGFDRVQMSWLAAVSYGLAAHFLPVWLYAVKHFNVGFFWEDGYAHWHRQVV